MNAQMQAAKESMSQWLAHPGELGKKPSKIECVQEFDLHDMHYYVFRYKKGLFGDWLLGVCGGYEEGETEHCGHVFSNMEKYEESTAVEKSIEMVEQIRAYWMSRAREQQKAQEAFKENLKYISQTELDAELIEKQFVRSQTRFYLTVGEIDCPTGKIVVSDPLCYLAAGKHCPQMEIEVNPGTYPVEVSICRNPVMGIRMCSARMKITDKKAVRYENAASTKDTAAAVFEDGVMNGFPVEAGMMSFCDAQVAKEYFDFLENWEKENPGKNHYDDYFAEFFAQSAQQLPAYQRDGGDFIEWANPTTGNKLVMVASGFGDGFYQPFWGYDADGEICELIVPMVNADLMDEVTEE